jgi:hypothetical protein
MGMKYSLDHAAPLRKIRSAAAQQAELVHHPLIESLLVEQQRYLVDGGHIPALDYRPELDVAEERNFALHFLG